MLRVTHDTEFRVNWRTFNVSSMVAVTSLILILGGMYYKYAETRTNWENRITAIEKADMKDDSRYDKGIGIVQDIQSKMPMLELKVNQLEVQDDKTLAALEDVRDALTAINISLGVLTEQVKALRGDRSDHIPTSERGRRS